MYCVDLSELKTKALCHRCVGEAFLSDEIGRRGKRRTCSYCGRRAKSYTIEEIAARVETAFQEHYRRTSDQPDSFDITLLSDPESNYQWERDGEPVVEAIMNSAEMPEAAANDTQAILENKHEDISSAEIGEETEFSGDAFYDQKDTDDSKWRQEWESFEQSLKTEARFFNQIAVSHLSAVFDGVDGLRTRDGRSLVVKAGPGTHIEGLFRARVFQSDVRLEEALCLPDQHLGSPPSRLASAGRMNARGISVFYGATELSVAVAEVRPPVGAKVAIARFEIIRPLRLLDLTALGEVSSDGSVYDPEFGRRLERAVCMTRPVMPDDEPFDYLPTQAVADFLATQATVPLDGMVFPSVQTSDGSRNVVLFHKAARVAAIPLPDGATIRAQSGEMCEDGWVVDYTVIEEVPPAEPEPEQLTKKRDDLGSPFPFERVFEPWTPPDPDYRDPALQIDLDSVTVHHVRAVQFTTEPQLVERLRWDNRQQDF